MQYCGGPESSSGHCFISAKLRLPDIFQYKSVLLIFILKNRLRSAISSNKPAKQFGHHQLDIGRLPT